MRFNFKLTTVTGQQRSFRYIRRADLQLIEKVEELIFRKATKS